MEDTPLDDPIDLLVVGLGAAGLMAAIHAARAAPTLRVVGLDGQARLGAKILISGGGRCNVTHHTVDERAFHGSTPAAIRKVLRRYGVEDVTRFFASRGVSLKREATGKLFPTSNRARTVLDALLAACDDAGVERIHPARVTEIQIDASGFTVQTVSRRGDRADGERTLHARRVVLAAGGASVPETGSDGSGFELVASLGHTLTPQRFPALVPLLLPEGHPLTKIRGIALPARFQVLGPTGKRIATDEGATLMTHFGLSGPGVLDVSRLWLHQVASEPESRLLADWLPTQARATTEAALLDAHATPLETILASWFPERFAEAVLVLADVAPGTTGSMLRKAARRRLLDTIHACPLPIEGPRGWRYAEVTAGGVPLAQLRLDTMESRITPGLHLCGEICDVDGRIGGFNFQWAWASGFVAGDAAARACV